MSGDSGLSIGIDIALLTVMAGLILRGRWRLSVFFSTYVAAALGGSLVTVLWPERFFTQAFWVVMQTVFDVLKLAIALEVGWRTFRVFPGAFSVARRTVLMVLIATTVAVISVPLAGAAASSYETAISEFHPRVIDGSIWLMASVLAVAHWYRVPVHRFHGAVLTSLAVYLAFYSTLLRLFAFYDFERLRPYVNFLDRTAYLLLVCWWACVAWRAENTADRARMNTLRELEFRMSSAG